eukprot:gene31971-33898_t
MAFSMDDAQKASVKKQMEFYFSDSNLPKDKFLKDQIATSTDGYNDLAVFISFAREMMTEKRKQCLHR